MASKTLPKAKYLKHPYTKSKLRVLDEFKPHSQVECPMCLSQDIGRITVVDSEYRGGIRYHILHCDECGESTWVVLIGRMNAEGP